MVLSRFIVNNKIRVFFPLLLVFVVSIFVSVDEVRAACSCSTSFPNTFLGFEFIAETCPQDGDNAATEREYKYTGLQCASGVLKTASVVTPTDVGFTGEETFTTAEIIAMAKQNNMEKIFVNESGTHVMSWHKSIAITIEGVTGAVGNNVSAVFDKYCTHTGGLPETDGDGYTSCFDCDDTNPGVNPGATEVCGDGSDNNCNGLPDCADDACDPSSPENIPCANLGGC